MSEPILASQALPTQSEREAVCICGKSYMQRQLMYPVRHGTPRAGLWSPNECAACAEAAALEHARHVAQARREERERNLPTPTRYVGATLTNLELHGTKENRARIEKIRGMLVAYLEAWPKVDRHLLLFRGQPGTGKGHVLWSVVRHVVIEHGATVRVVKLPSLIRDLRESWRKGSEGPTEEERLKEYRRPDLLVIDEVSNHAFYGEPTRHLYDVLDDRMDWCRPTILTTNESEQAIAELLGPALWDRLLGYGELVEFGSESYRKPRK